MNKENFGKDVLRELEIQNPAIAQVFRTFRLHGDEESPFSLENCYAPIIRRPLLPPFIIPLVWLSIGIGVGVFAADVILTGVSYLAMQWKAILTSVGGVCIGVGPVLIVRRVDTSPLSAVAPPETDTESPLQDLKELAKRAASRLRIAYFLQLGNIVIVGIIFVALIVWSIVMVSQERILYATAFGSTSIIMVILTRWKWQPFDRINQARQLADNADILATGLRLRMKTISEINDPSNRAKAQWDAVKEYLDYL